MMFELLQMVCFVSQPVIILCQWDRRRKYDCIYDWSNRSVVTKNTMFYFIHHPVIAEKYIFMALLKRVLFFLSMLFWNMKRSVCVWPLHTTLPILQCDKTFVLAWIETLFSYLMLWYRKMFFKQKTLHLCLSSLIFTSKWHTCKCF